MITSYAARIYTALLLIGLCACSTQKQVSRLAGHSLLQQPALATAHIGISIMDEATQRYVYNYQGNKYFIPASNTKLLTCYAAMKYLGDSLDGLEVAEYDKYIFITPTADPTLLHPDFAHQPVMDFLQQTRKELHAGFTPWNEKPYGMGWAWDDYEEEYMVERSRLPVYGNVVAFENGAITPAFFKSLTYQQAPAEGAGSSVKRAFLDNHFIYNAGIGHTDVPFITSDSLSIALLAEALHKTIQIAPAPASMATPALARYVVHSQPVDSVLRIMMHRSDNFLAEQSLLMVGRKRTGIMKDAVVIDTLLATVYNGMPQRPRWVDGSGLSRYNLISPQDFVWLLAKMKAEFGWQRITGILPTGGEGTLRNYYTTQAGHIYAKTGSFSNNINLSGYLLTQKGKIFCFSVMVNDHQAPAATVRRAVEAFLTGVINRY